MWWNEETDILDIIGGAKERLLDADGFAASIDRDDDALVEAVEYFRVYQQALRDAGAIDFADMVPLVVKAMNANESYRRSITSTYDHVLVDEYQDVNPGQVGLIDHFVNDGVRLWAVGDDDQTLYAFRASDVRYILEFTKKFPAADIHALDRNYRSCPDIVLAAKRLIRHNRLRFDKDYQPTLTEPGELVIRGYSSPEIEARQVGRAIAELIQARLRCTRNRCFVPRRCRRSAVADRAEGTRDPIRGTGRRRPLAERRGQAGNWRSLLFARRRKSSSHEPVGVQ